MPTWYIDEYSYNPNFTEELDQIIHAPALFDEALGLDARSSVFGGRVHGNPNLESSNIGWQESPARMRDQDAVYEAAINAGGDAAEGMKAIFAGMPDVWKTTGGFHIMDADDPMLVEKGEDYVHKQFTDYFVDHIEANTSEWDVLMKTYLFKNLVNNIALGVVPAGVVVEPLRQYMGLPYEWHGASTDTDN